MDMRSLIEYFIYSNIVIALLASVILVIKKILKQRISHKVYYYLWFLVMLKIILVIGVPSPVHLEDGIKDVLTYPSTIYVGDKIELQEISDTMGYKISDKENHIIDNESRIINNQTSNTYIEKIISYINHHEELMIIYGFITLILLMIPISSSIVLRRDYPLSRCENEDSKVHRVLDLVKHKIGSRRNIGIQFSKDITRPGVLGVFRPIVLLPDSYQNLASEKLELILLHEVMHINKQHLLIQWSAWFLKAINWINPLMWLSHHEMKKEAELWCDDEVAKLLDTETLIDYGNLIIDISTNEVEPVYQMNVVGFGNNNKELKERIHNMSIASKSWLGFGSIVVIVIIFVFFGTQYFESIFQEQPSFVMPMIGETIKVHDVASFIPKEAKYKNGVLTLVFDGELSKELIDLYEEVAYKESNVEMISDNEMEDFVYISGFIDFPASGYEEIRRKQLNFGMDYISDENQYIINVNIDEKFEKDYSYETFGPCYINMQGVSMVIPASYQNSMIFEDESSKGTMDFGHLGKVDYGNITLDGDWVSFRLKQENDDFFRVNYYVWVTDDRSVGGNSGTIDQSRISTYNFRVKEDNDGYFPMEIIVGIDSINFMQPDNGQKEYRFEIREGKRYE